MDVEHYFSDPHGDIPVDPATRALPFLLSPSRKHPFLTVGDYFDCITHFFLRDDKSLIRSIVEGSRGGNPDPGDISRVLIRSEKHGALYHVASVELVGHGIPRKVAVSTALSARARACLSRDCELLERLRDSPGHPYIPRVYARADLDLGTSSQRQPMVMCAAEWFEGYHEWHLTAHAEHAFRGLCIWDQAGGHRYASPRQAAELFRQAASILTLFYDTGSFRQISPWHHAAGDFVVRTGNGGVDTRLTTVRGYAPVMDFSPRDAGAAPFTALLYFMLDTLLRMRLDKVDGVGPIVLAGQWAVDAALRGAVEAIAAMEAEGRYRLGKVADFLELLASFTVPELVRLHRPIMDRYEGGDPEESALMKAHLGAHAALLHDCIHRVA